jgi:hypothetical protein
MRDDEFPGLIFSILKEASEPAERLARNIIILAILTTVVGIVHSTWLFLVNDKPLFDYLLVLGIVICIPVFIALFFGIIIAGVYDGFLKHMGATRIEPNYVTHLIEWAIALCVPLSFFVLYTFRS